MPRKSSEEAKMRMIKDSISAAGEEQKRMSRILKLRWCYSERYFHILQPVLNGLIVVILLDGKNQGMMAIME